MPDNESQQIRPIQQLSGSALTVTPLAYVRYVNLARQTYLQSEGLNLSAEYKLDADLSISVFGETEYQRFYGIDVSPDAFNRTGWQYRIGAGLVYRLAPDMQLSFDVSHQDKQAYVGYYAYSSDEAALGHTWLFPGGQFLLTTVSVARDVYDASDPAISPNLRSDWRMRGRITFGQPVADLFGVENPAWWLRDLALTISLETIRSDSNISNYTYTNHRAGFALSKRFEF